MQLIQTDPRFMDVFKELTGIDFRDIQEQERKKEETQRYVQQLKQEQQKIQDLELIEHDKLLQQDTFEK